MTDHQQQLVKTDTNQERRLPRGLIGAGLLLAILLVGGAFMAGRLLEGGLRGAAPAGPAAVDLPGGNWTSAQLTARIERAAILPPREPEASGVYQSRSDNVLQIGTGNLGMAIQLDDGSTTTLSSSYDGPLVEVVITGDTTIYEDITDYLALAPDSPPGSGEPMVIEQQVRPVGGIEGLDAHAQISAWGQPRGERIIADLLVYRNPGS